MSEFPEYMTRDLPDGSAPDRWRRDRGARLPRRATSCGIKIGARALPDLAMLVADVPCVAAATFTTSRTAAHTVQLCKEHLAATGVHRARPSSSTAATPTAPTASGACATRGAWPNWPAQRLGIATRTW